MLNNFHFISFIFLQNSMALALSTKAGQIWSVCGSFNVELGKWGLGAKWEDSILQHPWMSWQFHRASLHVQQAMCV